MDNSFIIYDDISLNDEILHDLELSGGDSNFIWNLEPPGQQLFPETFTSEINGNENCETVSTKTLNYFNNSTPSCSSTDSHRRQDQDDGEDVHIPKDSIDTLTQSAQEEIQSFECSICGKCFVQQSSCNRHKREQHLQPKRFQCNKCGLRFSKKYNLQTHHKRAHPKDKNGFKCPICCCIYSKSSTLKKHIKDYHSNENMNIYSSEDNDPQQEAENALNQLKLLQKDIEDGNLEHLAKANKNKFKDRSTKSETELTSVDEAQVKIVTLIDRLYPFGETQELKVQQIIRNDNIKYFVCEFCSKEFRKSYGYLRHRRIHCSIRPFICVICKKAFATQNKLKRHSRKHTIKDQNLNYKGSYKCPKCFEFITSLSSFDKHLNSHLPDTSIVFKCSTCNKSFTSLRLYFRHKHKADDPELNMLKMLLPPPLCLLDGNEFLNVIENNSNNTFPCSLCGLNMSSTIAWKQHEKRHWNLRKYQCQICNGFYASKSSLDVHMRIHLNQCNFKCCKCLKHFRTNFQLKRHQLRHSNIKIFKCRYCDEMFKTSQYCRSHMMTHLKNLIKTKNSEENPQQIKENIISIPTLMENSNKTEIIIKDLQILKTSQSNTKKEMEIKENSKLPYQCTECPLKFRYKAWLKKHQTQTHSEERPFRCEICGKSFRLKQTLKSHLSTHDQKRFKETCLVCGKKYASEKSLKVHLRLHTEEKPFQCELCEKSFRTSGHLIQHRKVNHKENLNRET